MLAGLLLALLVGLAGCGASTPRHPQNQDEVPRISPAQLKERLLCFYLETADVVPHDTDQRG